jgi:hypothetical protein
MRELGGIWEEAVVIYFQVLVWYLPGGSEESHEHSGELASRSRFELGTSWIQCRSANHLTGIENRLMYLPWI